MAKRISLGLVSARVKTSELYGDLRLKKKIKYQPNADLQLGYVA